MSTRAEIALLVLILVLAALLRFLWLDLIPVGWHYDEAMMGIMASDVFRGVERPIFFPAYGGQEPLYIYLSAGMMWLMGGNQDILPLRVTSALVGVATVLVAYLLGRELYGRRVGLIGATLLTFSFWHVMLSRDGYRVITQPLLEGLTVFLLWRATHRTSIWYYLAAAVAFGSTIYTYLGARAFPGVLILFALWALVTRGLPPARVIRGLLSFAVVASAIAAPLLLYFATHPGTFSSRMSQISIIQPGATAQLPLRSLLDHLMELLGTFTMQGSMLWRYNLAGRPIFVGAVAVLFYVGLIVAVKDVLVRRRAAAAMIVAWFAVMLLPSFLSWEVVGYTLRSLGEAPILFLLPALGLVATWDWLIAHASQRWRPKVRQAIVGATVLILLVDGATTYRDYFDWATSTASAYDNMEDVVDTARFLSREARPDEEDVFISSNFYPHLVIEHLAPAIRTAARWFDGNDAIVLSPQSSRKSLYVFPFSALPRQLDRYLPAEGLVTQTRFDNGATKLVSYRLTPDQVKSTVDSLLADPSFTREDKDFGDVVELLASRTNRRVQGGSSLVVDAVWRVLKDAPPQEYVTYVHVLDNKNATVAQWDKSTAFPTPEWRAGDIVLSRHEVPIGDGVASGKYAISMGVYDRATMERLPLAGISPGRTELSLRPLKVISARPPAVNPSSRIGRKIGDNIVLLGFDQEIEEKAGATQALRLTLYWHASSAPPKDYTVFVQLLSPDGRLLAQSDDQPAEGRFPTSFWEDGDNIIDMHVLPLDRNARISGRNTVIVGMYLLSTRERLPVEGGGDHIVLGELDL